MSFIIFDHIPKQPTVETINIKVLHEELDLPTRLTPQLVDFIWETEESKGKKDFERYYLKNLSERDGCLSLELVLGTYKTFFVGNLDLQEKQKKGDLPKEVLEDYLKTTHSILGVNIVVALHDGLLYGVRSAQVTQAQGMMLPPAGAFRPDHFESKYKPHAKDGPNPAVSAQKQLFAETGIVVAPESLKYLGIARSTDSENPSFIFLADLSTELDSRGLAKQLAEAKDAYEHKDFVLVDKSVDGIADLLAGRASQFLSLRTGKPYVTPENEHYKLVTPDYRMSLVLVGTAAAALYARQYGKSFFNYCLEKIRCSVKMFVVNGLDLNYRRATP